MASEYVELMAWQVIKYGVAVLVLIILFKVILTKIFHKESITNDRKGDKINRGLNGSGLKKSDNPEGFIFGKLGNKKVYLANTQEGHITIFGGSGKGKTAALLIPSLKAWKSPFFAIDISGDISRAVATKESIILSPDDQNESCTYNIFYNIDVTRDEGEKREKLEQLVNLIVDIPEKANDTQIYFLTTARKIFLACMVGFYDIGMDFVDICKTCFFNNVNSLAELVAATDNELALNYILPLVSENEKNIAGAKSTLNDKIKLFADNDKMEKILTRQGTLCGRVHLNPHMLNDHQIFLKVPDHKQEVYKNFLHIVTGQMLEYISSRKFNPKTDKRILLALDEFASLGYFEILDPFRKFRKNGANICILTQSLADIDLVYSEKERQVILDNSKYIVVLSANDNSTRDYFSGLVGKEEIKLRQQA